MSDTIRFNALRREVEGINQKMLGQTLRKLERNGLVRRRAYATMPMTVEYGLTEMGRTLLPVIEQLQGWSMSNIDAVTSAQKTFDREQAGGSHAVRLGRIAPPSPREPER